MMKKSVILGFILMLSSVLFAGDFVLISVKNQQHLQQLFQQTDLVIHYYDDFSVFATADHFVAGEMTLLEKNAFATTNYYYLVYCPQADQNAYLERESTHAKVLYQTENRLLVRPLSDHFLPAKNDGMVAIFNRPARLPKSVTDYPVITEEDADIRSMMNQIDVENLTATVQHLQDYGTRRFSTQQARNAQTWLFEQYEALGLEVSLHDFEAYNTYSFADNVIALQRGTTYPDEYVVCGCHYDSYTFAGGHEPGADDNATGCAAVLETARILSQYDFERSIIYCSFGAEEIGLVGSEAFAHHCALEGLNIVGYFNNDMNGYLLEGTPIHIDMIYPSSAAPIGNYYKNICNIYFPDMAVNHESFMSGDSDHTSFNQNGYMGIYPFEDHTHYSPYIHTDNDIIGLSVNNWELSNRYTAVNLGCVATLANLASGNCRKPYNLAYSIDNQQITISWQADASAEQFEIYRNDELITTTDNLTFTEAISVGTPIYYGIKALYNNCESGVARLTVAQTIEPPSLWVENAFATTGSFSLKISVSEVAGAKYYPIYNQNGSLRTTIYPFFRSFYLFGCQEGNEYCFTAKTVGELEGTITESGTTNLVCETAEVVCIPPKSFDGQLAGGKVTLIWVRDYHVKKVNLFRNDVLIAENLTALYYIDNQPLTGENCYYLQSICNNGNSDFTEPLCYEVASIAEPTQHLLLSPNPAGNFVNITASNIAKVQAYNSLGVCVQTIATPDAETISLSTADFPAGIYLFRITFIDGTMATRRVVVIH